MEYFSKNQMPNSTLDEIASQTGNNLNDEDVDEVDDLLNENMDDEFDTRNVMPLEQYNGEQIKIAFSEENITRLTKLLGHEPSEMEVIDDYIDSGLAAKYASENRAA